MLIKRKIKPLKSDECMCEWERTKRIETKGKLNGCNTHLYAAHHIEEWSKRKQWIER